MEDNSTPLDGAPICELKYLSMSDLDLYDGPSFKQREAKKNYQKTQM